MDRRVWADVDLDALASNLRIIRSRAGSGVRVMLVVKGDAYGHGAIEIARHAAKCGVAAFAVSSSSEALELRDAGLRLPILVMGTVIEDELVDCLRRGIQFGLHSTDRHRSLQELARRMDSSAKVHLNIDTGMGHLGVLPSRALDLLQDIDRSSHVALAGVMTHISSSTGTLDENTSRQTGLFDDIVRKARRRGLLNAWCHVSNSAALFTGLDGAYDTVRPGIAALGALPLGVPAAEELSPVLAVRSRIVFLKDVPAGHTVGADSTWRANRPTRIATLPVGHGDGLPAHLGGRGEVLLDGRRAPIVGRLSFDFATVDVGHLSGVRVGDTVTLLGPDGSDRIRLEDVAHAVDMTPHGLASSLGERIERHYSYGGTLELPDQHRPISIRQPTGVREESPRTSRTRLPLDR